MRAARLLHMLLILQNRGRQSVGRLAAELEVSRRTVQRDLDALTEAGLPVITWRGAQGGVELGFDYRTRLTGLDASEAEAMGLLLSLTPRLFSDLGLAASLARAQAKMREAFPDQTRARISQAQARFQVVADPPGPADPRRAALAEAVRTGRVVRLQARSLQPVTVHPVALELARAGWTLHCALTGRGWPEADWGDVNISARHFTD